MKYIYHRKQVQGNRLDRIRFDSSPFTSIPNQYGYHSIDLMEIEEKATPHKQWFQVLARQTSGGRRIHVGTLEMLTPAGIRARMREFEHH